MRFVLDEDVDASVVGALVSLGHEAWTVPQSGLQSVNDETVAVYGHQRSATVITHDKEFSAWRKRNCVGRHLQLKCDEPDAVELVERHMAGIVAVMERYEDIFCELGWSGASYIFQWV